MKNICIIPARGGSVRIPKKNIIDFFGKPLLAYTIEAAKRSKLFGNNIYVSSDDKEILKISSRFNNIKTIVRPQELCQDKATLEGVVLHALDVVDKKFDYLCLLMPNCPFRNAADIRDSRQFLIKSKANCLMSVVDYYWLHPFWALQEKDNDLKFFFGNKYLVDSKKLPSPLYCPTGAVRWVKVVNFLKEKKFYGKNLKKYEIPFERSVDIDTYKDLVLAKKLFKIPANL